MDDCQFPLTFVILLLSSSFILFLRKAYSCHKISKTTAPKLPPGPWKLPLIGHLHHVGKLPHRSFRELAKKYGPLMHFRLGHVTTIVVSSPDIARQVLKVHDPIFTDRPHNIAGEILWYNYSAISFSPYGDYWRQMRKVCILELLSAKNVKSFASIRNDEVARLVGSIRASAAGAPVNLTQMVFTMASAITCRAAFGKVCRDVGQMIDVFKEGITLVTGFDVSDLYPEWTVLRSLSWNRRRLLRMRKRIDVIIDGIIDEHRRNLAKTGDDNSMNSDRKGNGEFGNEDLIDVLLRVKNEGELQFPITDDNIKAIIFDMFAAGTETSSTTIDWIMSELMRSPRILSKVQTEIREALRGKKKKKKPQIVEESDIQNLKYLKLVIKEALRLHAPVPMLPRVSREATEIEGCVIPAGARVLVNAWAIGRDPSIWEDPERFVPERFENDPREFTGNWFEYIPFGAGRRMCPGMTFGLASVELPLANLLYSFEWKLPGGMEGQDLDMSERPAVTAARKQDLELVAVPYHRMFFD